MYILFAMILISDYNILKKILIDTGYDKLAFITDLLCQACTLPRRKFTSHGRLWKAGENQKIPHGQQHRQVSVWQALP